MPAQVLRPLEPMWMGHSSTQHVTTLISVTFSPSCHQRGCILLCFDGCGTIQMLLFPLWLIIANILYQAVSSAVTYDRFQFINEVSKTQNKTKQNKTKNLQEFINIQCFMAATGFEYFTYSRLTQSFITVHCFSTLICFKCFYNNPGAIFLIVINSQSFSFGA